jgi:hypothetical protein
VGGGFGGWVELLEFVCETLDYFVALFCGTEDTEFVFSEDEVVDEVEIIGGFGLEIGDTFFDFGYFGYGGSFILM